MKVPAIIAVYYNYLVEHDEASLNYVPIPLRKQVRRLLRANPTYRAKHPEIMPKKKTEAPAPAEGNNTGEQPKENKKKSKKPTTETEESASNDTSSEE